MKGEKYDHSRSGSFPIPYRGLPTWFWWSGVVWVVWGGGVFMALVATLEGH